MREAMRARSQTADNKFRKGGLRMKTNKYSKEMPRRMYTFFRDYNGDGVPSFSKFALSSGLTLEGLHEMRRHPKFDEAYRECLEIRRDRLIDAALSKRHDSSLTKFLLSAEYKMGEQTAPAGENGIELTLEVIGEGKDV